jgi:hypothetical protein
MVLVQLSVVEQRLDAVRAVLAGATATEVAASVGVSCQSVLAVSSSSGPQGGGDFNLAIDIFDDPNLVSFMPTSA